MRSPVFSIGLSAVIPSLIVRAFPDRSWMRVGAHDVDSVSSNSPAPSARRHPGTYVGRITMMLALSLDVRTAAEEVPQARPASQVAFATRSLALSSVQSTNAGPRKRKACQDERRQPGDEGDRKPVNRWRSLPAR